MNRREFCLTALVAATANARTRTPARTTDPDATALAAMIRSGEITSAEAVARSIERIEKLNPKLNAVVHERFDAARTLAAAQRGNGVFDGVPYGVKETQEFAGLPCTKSSRALATRVAQKSNPFIDAFTSTGAIAVGATNAPEYALLPTTEPLLYGATRNPWDPTRSAGGSSGGSAAAVASGMFPIATGSDSGGSIRIPASHCGLFGFKNSRGLDVGAETEFLSVRGVLSRSVRDCATSLVATETRDPVDMERILAVTGPEGQRLRVAFSTRNIFGEEPHPQVAQATRDTAALLASLGHHVTEEWLPMDGQKVIEHFMTFWSFDALARRQFARQFLGHDADDSLFEPWTLGLMHLFEQQRSCASIEAAYEYFRGVNRVYRLFLKKYDVYVTPVVSGPPVVLGELAPTVEFATLMERVTHYVSYSPVANIAGTPSMSVPLTWTPDGLPIGTLISAGYGRDARLLGLAYELEQARPWGGRWPALSAPKLGIA